MKTYFKKTFLFFFSQLVTIIISLNFISEVYAYEQTQWQSINIKNTDLVNPNIYLQTFGGKLRARCHPDGDNLIPNFSAENESHLCENRSIITPGSYGKILKVYKLSSTNGGREYAIQWQITDTNNTKKISGRAKKNDIQWIYYNPKNTPFLQLSIDDKGWTDANLGKYFDLASKGSPFNITNNTGLQNEPLNKNESIVANTSPLNSKTDGTKEERSLLKASGIDNAVVDVTDFKNTTNKQSASPKIGQLSESLPSIIEKGSIEANKSDGNFCNIPLLDEGNARYPNYCSAKPPSQRVNGAWRTCNSRNLVKIDRHAQGAKTKYSDWVKSIVTKAADETIKSSTKRSLRGSSNNCVNPALMMAIMDQESSFHPMASNGGHDFGIAQFQMSTAKATQKYLEKLADSSSPMLDVIKKNNKWMPPHCNSAKAPWAKTLSKSCFESIQKNCVENGKLVASLFCPQYAIRLQAFHFKQICEESVLDSNHTNITTALIGNGDPVAQIRFLVSRYNRGNRIYNSASFYESQHKKYPSAREYGVVWAARRTKEFRRGGNSTAAFSGDGLAGHTINRCYNWRIAGLCGGLKDTVFSSYTKKMCPDTSTSNIASEPMSSSVK